MGLSLLLAVCVNRVLRSGRLYTTLLVWPYAVAPAAAGLLWWFMFNPTYRHPALCCCVISATTGTIACMSGDAMVLIVIAAAWKQISYNFLFFVAGLQSVPQSLIGSRRDRWRRSVQALLDHGLPAALADDVLPGRRSTSPMRMFDTFADCRLRPPPAALRNRPTRWSTRSMPTVSSGSISALPPPSRSC